MNPSSLRVAASFFVGSVLLACSSKGSNPAGGGSSYGFLDCPTAGFATLSAAVQASCSSCAESKCASDLATVNSACASYFDCACPTGVDAEACADPLAVPFNADGGVANACAAAYLGTQPSTDPDSTPANGGLVGCLSVSCVAACAPVDGG